MAKLPWSALPLDLKSQRLRLVRFATEIGERIELSQDCLTTIRGIIFVWLEERMMSLTIKKMNADDCFDVLRHGKIGILGCSHEDKPYLVPIHFAYEERKIYAFSLEGKKIGWMRANPQVCVLVYENTSPGAWRSVIASGRFEELPDKDGFASERQHAWSVLQKKSESGWWEPGALTPEDRATAKPREPIFFGIWVEEISGRHCLEAA
ncbi:pyridoxamine 5'-phosphate oxidase family protein [Rhizobium rhizogenes]|uniref:pyridoxamine 5'-phosphate oxidase family protein n=1 Tax=Rhizobium rhizogenes TaxID=359 RepID=UPI00157358F5|nr:pyridoxamine 5'-phosphate oxidase family protein [Rhizobium rhizogenes]NTF82942.1 pyridoxamine 5'-phosphate oxidase family protein [Rhizobium rhizogenes]